VEADGIPFDLLSYFLVCFQEYLPQGLYCLCQRVISCCMYSSTVAGLAFLVAFAMVSYSSGKDGRQIYCFLRIFYDQNNTGP
jgi:hypothetical protein